MSIKWEVDTPVIEERKNGPLVVKGVTRISRTDGEPVEAMPVMALCRCGHSKEKPFCDGSHVEAGFKSTNDAPRREDRLKAYEGDEVTVYYNPRLCAHVGICVRQAGNVFRSKETPWIQPDRGTVAEIEAVVAACPSGALQMSKPGEKPEQCFIERDQITVQKDGPYWVQDVQPPEPEEAKGSTARKYVLCRCGQSDSKPFCDGTHKDVGWTDDQS
ncbi:CDGSH iron-sulfur domain-containing protein [Tropicimonas sp.]|uniref:CDGSH iron-sulfur domain-containing protein n=1 Tax=Tropicimonas sp. TaxID=2067044 RepID=UPI003A8A2B19